MRHTYSAGGVVLDRLGRVLLINEGGNFWGVPKGQIEPGEDAITAAKREIEEEAGVTELTYLGELGNYQRHPYNFGVGEPNELKTITLFLFATKTSPADTNIEDNELEWVESRQAAKKLTDPKDKAFFESKLSEIRLAATRYNDGHGQTKQKPKTMHAS